MKDWKRHFQNKKSRLKRKESKRVPSKQTIVKKK